MPISVVIPTLDAAGVLGATIAALGQVEELIIADGGSRDGTVALAAAAGARVIHAPRGRGSQLVAGTAAAGGTWLLLLHADTRLQAGWRAAAAAHMEADPGRAGYFRFQLDSQDPRARWLERAVRWRCRALALPYGDQGLLISRSLLDTVGGISPIPLMEDVDLIRRLGRFRLAGLDAAALTSAAKWQRDGWTRRSARNLLCLALWFGGLPPRLIVRLYR
jgi:rSAM/selenodomain-associated transferase 2